MTEHEIRNMDPGLQMDRALGLALGYEEKSETEDIIRGQRTTHERGTIIRYGNRYILRRKDQPAVEWSPSTSWEGMGLVLEKVKTLHEDVFIEIDYEKGRWACYIWFGVIKKAEAFASEAPYAVAMAALLALRGGASG